MELFRSRTTMNVGWTERRMNRDVAVMHYRTAVYWYRNPEQAMVALSQTVSRHRLFITRTGAGA
jgi:hypothetical protein